jgi:Flp pilus assembly pilin Flp
MRRQNDRRFRASFGAPRMEYTLVALLLAMTMLGSTTNLDARVKLVLGDFLDRLPPVAVALAEFGVEQRAPASEKASAALPVRQGRAVPMASDRR